MFQNRSDALVVTTMTSADGKTSPNTGYLQALLHTDIRVLITSFLSLPLSLCLKMPSKYPIVEEAARHCWSKNFLSKSPQRFVFFNINLTTLWCCRFSKTFSETSMRATLTFSSTLPPNWKENKTCSTTLCTRSTCACMKANCLITSAPWMCL